MADSHPPESNEKTDQEIFSPPPPPPPPKDEEPKRRQPAGGIDQTPLPEAPPGYTIHITFHRATNLPMADVGSFSSDPFIVAQLSTGLPTRHKEDEPLRRRTPTIRRCTDPVWNAEWIVANVPESGFKLKARIYDEDPATRDDRLGNAHIVVPQLSDTWPGIDNVPYKVRKRSGSKRAYLLRLFATCVGTAKHMNGSLFVSVKSLGRTPDDHGGRVYTIGPQWYTSHYSPVLGRFVGTKQDKDDDEVQRSASWQARRQAQQYNFQANQMQLTGPVPWQLYHRFVEFKPWVKSMFTVSGIRGYLLSKALHHQHSRVYAYDRNTIYGVLSPKSEDVTNKFLDLVHYDKGGRIFTYVLTLDSLWRFTETGKEFGIDLLSKHTMHSNVSIYIAYSGEFFIRRLRRGRSSSARAAQAELPRPSIDMSGAEPKDDPPKDPSNYELIIDNDSGTYRPNANMLPLLKSFLHENLPGLRVLTLDCQADAELLNKLKNEQRERKKREGDHIVFTQASRSRSQSSSISSSDEEALDELAEEQDRQENLLQSIRRDQTAKQKARALKLKEIAKGKSEDAITEDNDESGEGAVGSSEGVPMPSRKPVLPRKNSRRQAVCRTEA